jgi:hypothetical protein
MGFLPPCAHPELLRCSAAPQDGQVLLEVWPGTISEAPPPLRSHGPTGSSGPHPVVSSSAPSGPPRPPGPPHLPLMSGSTRSSTEGSTEGFPASSSRLMGLAEALSHDAGPARAPDSAAQGAASAHAERAATQHHSPPDDWPTCQLHFQVRDTGIGISQQDLGRLFRSFSQVR